MDTIVQSWNTSHSLKILSLRSLANYLSMATWRALLVDLMHAFSRKQILLISMLVSSVRTLVLFVQYSVQSNTQPVYCCRTSSTWPNDLAVSSSFNPKTGFTAALVLGCDKNLMESISMRIYNSESTSTHPLLIMGILAEIERERHTELVRDKVFHLLKSVYAMSNTGQISATSTLRKENYSVDLWIKMSQLRIGLESWKMQLQKMITSIDEFEQRILCLQSSDQRPEKEDHKNDTWKPICKRAGQRIKKRLLEIVCDYDEKIRECTMVIDGMTLATHLVCLPANLIKEVKKLTLRIAVVESNWLSKHTSESENRKRHQE